MPQAALPVPSRDCFCNRQFVLLDPFPFSRALPLGTTQYSPCIYESVPVPLRLAFFFFNFLSPKSTCVQLLQIPSAVTCTHIHTGLGEHPEVLPWLEVRVLSLVSPRADREALSQRGAVRGGPCRGHPWRERPWRARLWQIRPWQTRPWQARPWQARP